MAVTAAVDGGIGRITLDRPPANSYDPAFLDELDDAIGVVVTEGAPVAVVASANEKFFSAGADVKGFLERDADANNAMVRRAHEVFDRFAAEPPVFIAQIAGHPLGGGYEIALACDIRIAAEGSYRIGLPEAIFCERKTPAQIDRIIAANADRLLLTRLAPEQQHAGTFPVGFYRQLVDPARNEREPPFLNDLGAHPDAPVQRDDSMLEHRRRRQNRHAALHREIKADEGRVGACGRLDTVERTGEQPPRRTASGATRRGARTPRCHAASPPAAPPTSARRETAGEPPARHARCRDRRSSS